MNATSATVDLAEFPFVAEMPKRERSRLRTVWDTFLEAKAITAEKGMLIPVSLAASLGGVSRTRIYQLCDTGALERVEFGKNGFVTESSFMTWVQSERKTGRPFSHLPDNCAGVVKMVLDSRKEERRK